MRYLIFDHNSNPAVDKPIHKASQAYGLQLLAEGHKQVGPRHIQLLPPSDYVADQRNHIAAGCVRDAWQPEQSGYGGPLVLQLSYKPRGRSHGSRLHI